MRKNVTNTLIIASLYIIFTCQGHAFDIDETVDDEIRKNYNPTQLIQDVKGKDSALEKKMQSIPTKTVIDTNLPELPSITGNKITKVAEPEIKTVPYVGGDIRVKQGTTFNVSSTTTISDWQRKGTTVKFISNSPTYGKGFSIPSGTVFIGEIIDSHQPQISCNGGLISLRLNYMIYKNQKVPITGYITRANDKKIFFNNIKGKRTYLKTVWQKGNWGRTIFNKMLTVSVGLGGENSTLILTPFPFAYGTLCLGANTIISPITAFFSKGEHISLPSGTDFKIKLLDDAMIN